MSKYDIKVRLATLCCSQKALLEKVRERGYPKLQYSALNSYISGTVVSRQADIVLVIADEILKEWEQ